MCLLFTVTYQLIGAACAHTYRMFKQNEVSWGISSAGRAPALQAGGRRFDPVILHQIDGSLAQLVRALC